VFVGTLSLTQSINHLVLVLVVGLLVVLVFVMQLTNQTNVIIFQAIDVFQQHEVLPFAA